MRGDLADKLNLSTSTIKLKDFRKVFEQDFAGM